MVIVRRETHVDVLLIAGFELADSGGESPRHLEEATTYLRAQARSWTEIETGDPADQSGRYRPFSIHAGQSTGGG